MPAPKGVSARPQSPVHSLQGRGDGPAEAATNGANPPVGERISTRGWSVESLLELGKDNFEEVERVSVRRMPPGRIVEVVRKYEELGRPLILEEWHLRKEWDKAILNVDYLVEQSPDQELPTRNIYNRSDKTTTLKEYIDYSRALPQFASKDEAERYYGKDAPVPSAWAGWLADAVPEPLQALGSGDMMSYLKDSDRPETLMCYFGVGDTYTPAHKDLCASIGHNLLTYSENDGSAFWFLSSTSDADAASTWFHEMNEELDLETHLATVEELAQAPFKVYICQQRLGDFMFVPKRGFHQVINHGGLNVKTSWSRMSIESLELSLDIELLIYRRVCRAEVHRVRLNVWEALRTCTEIIKLSSAEEVEEEARLLKRLFPLFNRMLAEEFDPDLGSHKHTLHKGESIGVVCHCCGGDIFQSFFRCLRCTPPTANPQVGLVLCAGCYCEGRTCLCGSEAKMQPCQMRNVKHLLADRVAAAHALRNIQASKELKAIRPDGSDLLELKHAPLFRLANHLLRIRSHAPKKIRKCNMHRNRGIQHEVAFDNARTCEQCHSALCYEHLLESFGIHCTELWWQDIMAKFKTLKYTRWHEKHLAQTGSVAKASFNIVKPGVEAQIGWAQYFSRLAWKYQDCHPISDHVRVGWYDPKILNVNKPKQINLRDPEFAPLAEGTRRKARRSAASTFGTPSRIQAKRNAAKEVIYVDESSDEIAANDCKVPILDKDKGKKRRLTDCEDSDYPVTENAAHKRRKVETKKGVYQWHIPLHVHKSRRRLSAPTQSDATSNGAMDILWNDDGHDGTTDASEVQTLPHPAPKSKQRPRRSVAKTIITIPPASNSPTRTRAHTRAQGSKKVPGPHVQGPPTPPSNTSPAFIPTSILLPGPNLGVPPFDLANFKAEIRAEVASAVAAQFTGIRQEVFMMRASVEALSQNGGEARLAEIEAREALLTAKEEEYEQIKIKEAELVKGLAELDMRYQKMEQELMERFATKERELLEKASGTQLRIEQMVQVQVGVSVDKESEEMELLAQQVSTEESTNYEAPIQQSEPFASLSQANSIVPFSVLEAQDPEEVTFQEVLVVAAEEETLPTDKVDKGLHQDGDGNDWQRISSIAPMVDGDYEMYLGREMTPAAHCSGKATEDQITSGPPIEDPTVMGYVLGTRVSKATSQPDSDSDAEADVDVEVVEYSAFTSQW